MWWMLLAYMLTLVPFVAWYERRIARVETQRDYWFREAKKVPGAGIPDWADASMLPDDGDWDSDWDEE